MIAPLLTYRLYVPLFDGDGQPLLAAKLVLIYEELLDRFGKVDRESSRLCPNCLVYVIASPQGKAVVDAAERVARLQLRPYAYVGLPNGHIAAQHVELGDLAA